MGSHRRGSVIETKLGCVWWASKPIFVNKLNLKQLNDNLEYQYGDPGKAKARTEFLIFALAEAMRAKEIQLVGQVEVSSLKFSIFSYHDARINIEARPPWNWN